MQVFPQGSLLTSEFDKIKDLIHGFCISPMGKELISQISPVRDPDQIRFLLNCSDEMKHIIVSGLPFPSTGYQDTAKELSLLKPENSVLTEEQFMNILTMMHTVKEIYSFFKNRKGQYSSLESILGETPLEQNIITLIENILDENGVVRSNASVELSRIRRSIQRTRAEADRIYNQVISKYRKQGWLTESEESSRNGRRVIAIFAEQKRNIRGIIHDTSTTGKTSFIEPEEVIVINKQVVLLEQDERLEVIRILRELSSMLRKYLSVMQVYRSQLGVFDLNGAKAAFAVRIDGKHPHLSETAQLDLIQARHPILLLHNNKLGKKTIPFDLKLNHENRILVISGPNAGGKTVCMKTSGLLQMMLQSGLLVSAGEESTFGIFENILVDIGDSQSIEYELSTYSSRLKHMKVFLERVNDKSLFLIDEFGTGTDPNLGGALAEAILEELNNRKAFGIITTHYLNLKVMADRTPGIMNGSMEFDLKKLMPLYKLIIGKPGSSYTFVVAERSGLPHAVVKNARRKVARKNLLLEKLLIEVDAEKSRYKIQSSELERKQKQLEENIRKYETLSRNTETSYTQKELRLKKLEEKTIRESEEKFRLFLKEWKKSKDKKEVFDRYYRLFVKKIKQEDPAETERKRKEKLKSLKEVLKPGSRVKLLNGNTVGIVEQIDNDTAYVIFGEFRTRCDLVNLIPFQ